ncbi:HAD family hydrolase [Palleronia sp. KMU-117]|uniref:HAD family hydrolase n=1 Tax=Palleronia sp. KMU-117 TaxID=3434108 RepID=UPI003D759F61
MTDTSLRGVIFDKDGTLYDFQRTWAAFAGTFLSDLAKGDPALFDLLSHVAGYDPDARRLLPGSVVIAETPAAIAELLLPFLPQPPALSTLVTDINTAALAAPLCPAVPLAPLLDDLRGRGLALGVATNDAEGPARAHLTSTGVLDRFDFIAGYDSGHGAKPGPGQLLAFADAAGLHPSQVLMVGDSAHDLVAGRAAGMATVGVLTGVAGSADLAPLADAVLPNIGGLPAWLDARGR